MTEPTVLPPLTPEQIASWRSVLVEVYGAYALIMPVADIEAIRTRMQREADRATVTNVA